MSGPGGPGRAGAARDSRSARSGRMAVPGGPGCSRVRPRDSLHSPLRSSRAPGTPAPPLCTYLSRRQPSSGMAPSGEGPGSGRRAHAARCRRCRSSRPAFSRLSRATWRSSSSMRRRRCASSSCCAATIRVSSCRYSAAVPGGSAALAMVSTADGRASGERTAGRRRRSHGCAVGTEARHGAARQRGSARGARRRGAGAAPPRLPPPPADAQCLGASRFPAPPPPRCPLPHRRSGAGRARSCGRRGQTRSLQSAGCDARGSGSPKIVEGGGACERGRRLPGPPLHPRGVPGSSVPQQLGATTAEPLSLDPAPPPKLMSLAPRPRRRRSRRSYPSA